MVNILTIFFSVILGFTTPSEEMEINEPQDSISTYYLIRHAEKDRSDAGNHNPDLTPEGAARAEKWAEALKDIKFDAVYSTNYNRTKQTAQPLAAHNKLEISSYDPRNLYDENFKKATSGKTVMIVGHSNTTPHFANAILGQKKYQDMDDSENGALFIVQVQPDGSATSQVIYIN